MKDGISKLEKDGRPENEIMGAKERQSSLILRREEILKRLAHLETDIHAKKVDLGKIK